MSDISEKRVDGPSFEEAFRELEEVVARLEAGNISLEESLALFERGTQLAAYCGDLLDQAEMRVHQLVPAPGGGFELAELKLEAGDSQS